MVRLSTAPLRALRTRPSAQQATRFVAPTFTRSFHISSPRSNAATPASKAPAAGAGLQGNIDLMTGEVIRTADIDVSLAGPPQDHSRYRASKGRIGSATVQTLSYGESRAHELESRWKGAISARCCILRKRDFGCPHNISRVVNTY